MCRLPSKREIDDSLAENNKGEDEVETLED